MRIPNKREYVNNKKNNINNRKNSKIYEQKQQNQQKKVINYKNENYKYLYQSLKRTLEDKKYCNDKVKKNMDSILNLYFKNNSIEKSNFEIHINGLKNAQQEKYLDNKDLKILKKYYENKNANNKQPPRYRTNGGGKKKDKRLGKHKCGDHTHRTKKALDKCNQ